MGCVTGQASPGSATTTALPGVPSQTALTGGSTWTTCRLSPQQACCTSLRSQPVGLGPVTSPRARRAEASDGCSEYVAARLGGTGWMDRSRRLLLRHLGSGEHIPARCNLWTPWSSSWQVRQLLNCFRGNTKLIQICRIKMETRQLRE